MFLAGLNPLSFMLIQLGGISPHIKKYYDYFSSRFYKSEIKYHYVRILLSAICLDLLGYMPHIGSYGYSIIGFNLFN
jgi:hypothetical protein